MRTVYQLFAMTPINSFSTIACSLARTQQHPMVQPQSAMSAFMSHLKNDLSKFFWRKSHKKNIDVWN
jgi:hypothetical protein